MQTDTGVRGQFARLAVQVNLNEPLVSKIRIAHRIHQVECESLPSICFNCGRFGHMKEVCPYASLGKESEEERSNMNENIISTPTKDSLKVQEQVDKEEFGDWVVVEHR